MEGLGPLLERAPVWSVVTAIFVVVVFSKTGLVPMLVRWISSRFRSHDEATTSEREQLSEDQRDILERYERLANEADARTETATKRYRENVEWYDQEFQRLRHIIAERDETIRTMATAYEKLSNSLALSETGSSRWRHACNNLLQLIHAERVAMRTAGIEPPEFTAMRNLLGVDPDIDKSLGMLREL